MNKPVEPDELEQRILDYQYGEMQDDARREFEAELQRNAALKQRFEDMQAFDATWPKGQMNTAEAQHYATSGRSAAMAELKQTQQNTRGVTALLKHVFKAPLFTHPLSHVVFATAFGFCCALVLQPMLLQSVSPQGSSQSTGLEMPSSAQDDPQEANPALYGFIASPHAQLEDLSVVNADPSSGELHLSVTVNRQSTVKGSLGQQHVKRLLHQGLRQGANDEARLTLIQLIGPKAEDTELRQLLIERLLQDPNPGVRYGAVEFLAKLHEYEDVRAALRRVLADEVNSGIRIEAFLALSKHLDGPTIKAFSQHASEDGNMFIRQRAKQILNQLDPEQLDQDVQI